MPNVLVLCSELRTAFREGTIDLSTLREKLQELLRLGDQGTATDRRFVMDVFEDFFSKSKGESLDIAIAVALEAFDADYVLNQKSPEAAPRWKELVQRLVSRRNEVPVKFLGLLQAKLQGLMSVKSYAYDRPFGAGLEGIKRRMQVVTTPTTPTQLSAPGLKYGDNLYSRRRG